MASTGELVGDSLGKRVAAEEGDGTTRSDDAVLGLLWWLCVCVLSESAAGFEGAGGPDPWPLGIELPIASYRCTMLDIELRRVPLRERGVSGGESACCANDAAASLDEGIPISAGVDLDAETGAMNIDAGRDRPVGVGGSGVAAGGIGSRRDPPVGCWAEEACFACLLGDAGGPMGCGDDDRGLFASGGGFIVDAGTMTELRLPGAVAEARSVGLLLFSTPPPHKSTRSWTELCRPLLRVLRLRWPSAGGTMAEPLKCIPPFEATFSSSFVFSPIPPCGTYPFTSSGSSSPLDDIEPCFDGDCVRLPLRLGEDTGLQLSVSPLGDGVVLCLAPVPEGI